MLCHLFTDGVDTIGLYLKDRHSVGSEAKFLMPHHRSEATDHARVKPIGYLLDNLLSREVHLPGQFREGFGHQRKTFLQESH